MARVILESENETRTRDQNMYSHWIFYEKQLQYR